MLPWVGKEIPPAVVDLLIGASAVLGSLIPGRPPGGGHDPSSRAWRWKERFRLLFRFAGLILAVLALLRLKGYI